MSYFSFLYIKLHTHQQYFIKEYTISYVYLFITFVNTNFESYKETQNKKLVEAKEFITKHKNDNFENW